MTANSQTTVSRVFPGPLQAVLLVATFLGVQIGIGVALLIVLSVVMTIQQRGGAAPAEMPAWALLTANAVAFAIVAAWSLTATRGRWREILVGGRSEPGSWLTALPLLLGTTLLVSECSNLQLMVMPVPDSIAKTMQTVLNLSEHPVITVLLVVVLAPIAEEFLFRGIILRGLLERMRPWRAIWLSTLLFTVMHLNPWQVPVAVGFGLLCGWVYLRTRSLMLCMVLHLLNNAAALFGDYWSWRIRGLNGGDGSVENLPGWLLLTAVAALGAGWAGFRYCTRAALEPPPLPAGEAEPVVEVAESVSRGL